MTVGERRERSVATAAEPLSVLVVTAFRPEEIVDPLAEVAIDAEVVTVDEDASPHARVVRAARETHSAIETHDPDVLLLDCLETIGAPATFVARRHGVPVVPRLVGNPWRKVEEEWLEPARERGDVPSYALHQVSRTLNEYVFRSADGFVVVSSALRDVVARRTDCPRDRVGVVPVPMTTDVRDRGSAAAARDALGVDEDRVVLTVTNLWFRAKAEGVRTVASALSDRLRSDPDLAYVVAGGGEHHGAVTDWLDETIEDPDARSRIYAPGYVDEIEDLYALADVFAYVSSLDGYPNAVLEAQAAELPVVANDDHGMSDQIDDGETGYLVDRDDEAAIAERIESLLDSPDERRRIGHAARSRVQRENAPEAIGRQLQWVLERYR